METQTEPKTLEQKFRQVYADSLHNDPITDAEMDKAMSLRQLRWRGERVTLAEAARVYALMLCGYNNFEPDMLQKLFLVFGDNIGVEPARAGSVEVYLFPNFGIAEKVKKYIEDNFNADEVDWIDGALRVWWD